MSVPDPTVVSSALSSRAAWTARSTLSTGFLEHWPRLIASRRAHDPQDSVDRPMLVFPFAQIISKLLDRGNRDSVQSFLSENRINVLIETRAEVADVRWPPIGLASKPFFSDFAENRHLRGLQILSARSLVQGLCPETLGLLARFEAHAAAPRGYRDEFESSFRDVHAPNAPCREDRERGPHLANRVVRT